MSRSLSILAVIAALGCSGPKPSMEGRDPDHYLVFKIPKGWTGDRLKIKTRSYRKAEHPDHAEMRFAVEDSAPPVDPARFIRKVLKETELYPGDRNWTTRKESRPGHEAPSINVFMEGSFTILGGTWQVRARSWLLDNTNVAIVTTYEGKTRTDAGDKAASEILESVDP